MTDIALRAKHLADAHIDRIRCTTDRLFLWLTVCELVGGVVAAIILSPRTYVGNIALIHPHVVLALCLGTVIATPMIVAILAWPGQYRTRVIVAVCQMLMSALLIHISGGRIETHFHVFGTLAFLAFYRDWRVLVWATLVVAGDHLIRGLYLPESVYGVFAGAEWRFVEHACWVLFEDVILYAACIRGIAEVQEIASKQAELEATNQHIESIVDERTEDLIGSELQKTTVFENALDALVSADSTGHITEMNPAAERIFGLSRHTAKGKHLSQIFCPGPSQESVERALDDHLGTGKGHVVLKNAELLAVSDEVAALPIEVSIMCVPIKGQPVYTAFVRDISERKLLEEQLSHANKMESLGQLATGVAHEINTPNQYIGDNVRFVDESFGGIARLIDGYKEALAHADIPSEKREQLAELEESADLEFTLEQIPPALSQAIEGVERVGSIIRAMKEFAHPGVKSFTMVDLNRVVETTVMVARNEWKYVADLELDLSPDLPSIQGNPGELSQVVLNLVVNSAQAIADVHTPDQKGLIRIVSRADGNMVELTVSDNGCGIKDEIRGSVFDPFFTTKGVGVGTGQGLSITRGVVERHSGEIMLTSKEGAGTTIRIRLPIAGTGEERATA